MSFSTHMIVAMRRLWAGVFKGQSHLMKHCEFAGCLSFLDSGSIMRSVENNVGMGSQLFLYLGYVSCEWGSSGSLSFYVCF